MMVIPLNRRRETLRMKVILPQFGIPPPFWDTLGWKDKEEEEEEKAKQISLDTYVYARYGEMLGFSFSLL